ncbi:MAG: ribosome small subunit-dependent GTPase A [Phycisphaerae bacterium]
MKKSKRKFFDEQLSKLTVTEKKQLYKRAANLRKAAQVNARNKRHSLRNNSGRNDWDNSVSFEKKSRIENVTIDDWALKVIEEEGINSIKESCRYRAELGEYSERIKATVFTVRSTECSLVLDDGSETEALLGPDLFMTQKSALTVGDRVVFAYAKDGTAVVQNVLDRKTLLSRPDPTRAGIERAIAANVDVAVIVAAIKRPELKPTLIDRYLIAAQKGALEPVICVNKIDLLTPEDKDVELEILAPYAEIGLPIVECSAETGAGTEELLALLHGKTCVFVGHSGTGKTSLLNSISPEIDGEVGEVHDATGLGRHTTTTSRLYDINGDIRIIDTPGIREFGLWDLAAEDLKWYFDEFDEFAESCRYSNCSHTHEPDCAVKNAVEKGAVSRSRYESYLRILDTIPKPKY